MKFLETSAKDSTNVEEAFMIMAEQILTTIQTETTNQSSTNIILDSQGIPVQPSYGWC